MKHTPFCAALATALAVFMLGNRVGQIQASAQRRTPPPPASVRLYVFDCGTLHIADLRRFRLNKEEVVTSDLSVACFLVAHPKGTLMWDPGAVPDPDWKPTGVPVTHHIRLPDSQERDVKITAPLVPSLPMRVRQSGGDNLL